MVFVRRRWRWDDPSFKCGEESCAHSLMLTPGYMVHNELWAKHGNGKGLLCIGCFEARLGRSLEIDDLKPVPLNAALVHGFGMALVALGEAEWPVRRSGEVAAATYLLDSVKKQ